HNPPSREHDRNGGEDTPEEIRIHTWSTPLRQVAYRGLLLGTIPEEGHWRGNHSLQVFGVGANTKILSSNDIRHAFIGCQLDLSGQPFWLRGIGGPRPRPREGFEPLIARPPKPRFVCTPTRYPHVDERIEGIRRNP